jgi:predicted kinase
LATTTAFDDEDINNNNGRGNIPTSSVLLLVGLPGSGKSTLAEALCRARPHHYVRINQDTLGNRQKCVQLARRTLLQNGRCPIIDRCNTSVSQRRHWTTLAQELAGGGGGAPVDCVVLDVPAEECLRRCQCRRNHPTLPPHQARGIIRAMQREWQVPSAQVEGFRSLTIVQQEDQDDLPNLVDRLQRLVAT